MSTEFKPILYDAHGRPIPPGDLPVSIRHVAPKEGHFDHGRGGHKPQYVIVHNTEGYDDAVEWLSETADPPASIHAIAERDKTRVNIVQYNDTAYHTGYAREPYHGYNTLGLEFANASNHWGRREEYADGQLWVGAHCVATWCYSYGLPLTAIHKHTEIAVWPPDQASAHPPGDLRRYDPSNFPWSVFMAHVAEWLDFFANLPMQWQPYYII